MSILRINKPVLDTEEGNRRQGVVDQSNRPNVNSSQPNLDRNAQQPLEDSLCRQSSGPQKPKGTLNNDFDLAHLPHSKYQFLEPFRQILVSLSLVRPRGANPLAWRMLKEVKPTNHPDDVSQMKSQQDILAIKLTGKLTGASAVHIMSRNGFILDSAIKLDDGTWVFSKARERYEKNASILFQTERNDGRVKNESLPLKALKAH